MVLAADENSLVQRVGERRKMIEAARRFVTIDVVGEAPVTFLVFFGFKHWRQVVRVRKS